MKLSDYISYRRRSKNGYSSYDIRTQHFYDGKPITDDKGTYTGIPANRLNYFNIPTDAQIAKEQKNQFIMLYNNLYNSNLGGKTSDMLTALNRSIAPGESQRVSAQFKSQVVSMIQELESACDNLDKLKISNSNNTTFLSKSLSIAYDQKLMVAFNKLKQIVASINNKSQSTSVDKYLQELQSNILDIEKDISTRVASTPAHPFFNLRRYTQTNKSGQSYQVSFIERLGYLARQIKGWELEHEGLEWFKKLPLPEEYEIVSTGQLMIDGKQLSQDGLIILKNAKIKVQGLNQAITLHDYFNTYLKQNHSKNISSIDYSHILDQSVGIQSKYSRYGTISMSSISAEDIYRNNLINSSIALKFLYNLHLGPQMFQGHNVSHTFNVKKQHPHYNALFSYSLSKFMSKILNKNYYMITKKGIQSSYDYYLELFARNRYFHPIGSVSLYPLSSYRVGINEN